MTTLQRFVMILLCCFSCTTKPDSGGPVQNVPSKSLSGNIDKGKVLYSSCRSCHGDNGEGNALLHAPAIANLDPWYAYRQLQNFKSGIRGYVPQDTTGAQMGAIAQTIADSASMFDVVAYIETFPEAIVSKTISGDVGKGQRTYESLCGSCHGPQGKGNQLMHAPRLNGLEGWYLKEQIRKFRTSLRGAHPHDKYGSPMVSMMALLRDERSIDDVIAYIQSTGPSIAGK